MKYDRVMMQTAELWADMSKCIRNKVGAVIAKDSRIISIGYNGTPSGWSNEVKIKCDKCNGEGIIVYKCPLCFGTGHSSCSEESCPECGGKGEVDELCSKCNGNGTVLGKSKYECEEEVDGQLKTDHSRVIHAEANAILFAAKNGIALDGTTMYVTTSPCPECSKMIIQSGIRRVVYKTLYRDETGLELMKSVGIEVEKLK